MTAAERQPLIRPFIALIKSAADRDHESISASSTPAKGDPQPVPEPR
jgi:hypothetical protein